MDAKPPTDAGLEDGQTQSPPSLPSDLDSAEKQVIDAGGNRGGRPREDGLVPGSPEAIEADRAKDAERKRQERAAKRNGGQPPGALPSALDAQSPDGGKKGGNATPSVLWKPGRLVRSLKTIVPGIEDWCQQRLVSKASQVQGLPAGMLEEIASDSAWDDESKDALVSAGSELAAKYLNKAGVPSEYEPEVNFISALVSIGTGQLMLEAKLEKWAKYGYPGQKAVKPSEGNKDEQVT